jgi:virulence-associated protein VagC
MRTNGRLFWSGGSQAVRLPKAMRLPGSEVAIERRGKALILSPISEGDEWGDFWDRLLPLERPVRRGKTSRAEKRRAI